MWQASEARGQNGKRLSKVAAPAPQLKTWPDSVAEAEAETRVGVETGAEAEAGSGACPGLTLPRPIRNQTSWFTEGELKAKRRVL